jgi:predicted transcriptional regulator
MLIIAHMLRTINDNRAEGASKTLIMYLSYGQLKEYLSFLLEKDLVEEQTGTAIQCSIVPVLILLLQLILISAK